MWRVRVHESNLSTPQHRGWPWCVQDRLETLASVREAGISVCAGGIIGLGEATMDRIGLLHQLATLPEHPESVPINALVAVKGTPLQVHLHLCVPLYSSCETSHCSRRQ